jgi:hypothetical protein
MAAELMVNVLLKRGDRPSLPPVVFEAPATQLLYIFAQRVNPHLRDEFERSLDWFVSGRIDAAGAPTELNWDAPLSTYITPGGANTVTFTLAPPPATNHMDGTVDALSDAGRVTIGTFPLLDCPFRNSLSYTYLQPLHSHACPMHLAGLVNTPEPATSVACVKRPFVPPNVDPGGLKRRLQSSYDTYSPTHNRIYGTVTTVFVGRYMECVLSYYMCFIPVITPKSRLTFLARVALNKPCCVIPNHLQSPT